jgi:hypothetical protein
MVGQISKTNCVIWRNFPAKFYYMVSLRGFGLLSCLIWMSCNSSADKLSAVQHDLMAFLGEKVYFEIKTSKTVLKLPLPPEPMSPDARLQAIKRMMASWQSIPRTALQDASDQKRFDDLGALLEVLDKRGGGAFFDPKRMVLPMLDNTAPTNLPKAELATFLTQIPAYYAEVERRWQSPDSQKAQEAADQSLKVLQRLETLSGSDSPAFYAVKDFICMCQSAVLQ